MKARTLSLIWLLWAIANFLVFAADIEYDRDFFTWLWLLTSILSFKESLRHTIRMDNGK